MTDPIDVINAAVFAADPTGRMGPGAVARIVVDTLPADDIVDHAVAFLRADQRENGYDSAIGAINCPDQFLADIARAVLESVGGTS